MRQAHLFMRQAQILSKAVDILRLQHPESGPQHVISLFKNPPSLVSDERFHRQLRLQLAGIASETVHALRENSKKVGEKLVHFEHYCEQKCHDPVRKLKIRANPRLAEVLLMEEQSPLEPDVEGFVDGEMQKGHLQPSTILASLPQGIRSDCGRAVELTFFLTLLDLIGHAKFDRIFNLTPFRLRVTANHALPKVSKGFAYQCPS